MNRLSVREVRLYERDVTLRLPFRFGVVTLTEAPQVFLRARIATEDGNESWGMAAELLAPKWFDKNPELSNEDNFEQLRTSIHIGAQLYRSDQDYRTPFGLFARNYERQISACAERDLNPLIAGFGPALLDRAALDALCRLREMSFYEAVRSNVIGMGPREFLPEFSDFDLDEFLASLLPRSRVHARHMVGLVDPITREDQSEGRRVGDGLPETLEEVIDTYGHRYFKIKVSGDKAADLGRLSRIASVLDRISEPYFISLDGNEQYEDVQAVEAFWEAMKASDRLGRFLESILFIEQPIHRKSALDRDVEVLSSRKPVIIDESDGELDAFPRARSLGYRGVSSKACKGFYKSLINRARCVRWNEEAGAERYFMSAEDLTTQAGVAVQQDLALVSVLGLRHVERNGHHYVNGMSGASRAEQEAFLKAHPDLYHEQDGIVRVKIKEGQLEIGSLACAGFAVGAEPEWSAMQEL